LSQSARRIIVLSVRFKIKRAALLAVSFLLPLSLSTVQAKAEWANFVGGGVMFDFDPSCIWDERPHPFSVRLNIPDLTDPDSSMTLSFLASHYAMSYKLESGRLNSDFQRVRAMTLYGTFENHRARVRLRGAAPDLTSHDPIRLRGTIRDMDGLGCNVEFDATVSRGPAV